MKIISLYLLIVIGVGLVMFLIREYNANKWMSIERNRRLIVERFESEGVDAHFNDVTGVLMVTFFYRGARYVESINYANAKLMYKKSQKTNIKDILIKIFVK